MLFTGRNGKGREDRADRFGIGSFEQFQCALGCRGGLEFCSTQSWSDLRQGHSVPGCRHLIKEGSWGYGP